MALLQAAGDEAGVGHAYNNLGWFHWRVGDYAEAIDACERALEVRERLGQRRYLAPTLNNIGIIYYQWGRYARALEYYLRALPIRQALSDSAGSAMARAYSLHNIGSALEGEGDLDGALQRYRASQAAYEEAANEGGIVLNRMAQGRVLNARGACDEALTALQVALDEARAIENQEHEAVTLMHIGMARHGLGQDEEALKLLRSSLSLAQSMDKRDLIMEVHLRLSQVLGDMGQPARALDHLRLHDAVKDSLFSTRYGQQLADMQARYETETLRREAEAQAQRIRGQEQRTFWVTAFLGLPLRQLAFHVAGLRRLRAASAGHGARGAPERCRRRRRGARGLEGAAAGAGQPGLRRPGGRPVGGQDGRERQHPQPEPVDLPRAAPPRPREPVVDLGRLSTEP